MVVRNFFSLLSRGTARSVPPLERKSLGNFIGGPYYIELAPRAFVHSLSSVETQVLTNHVLHLRRQREGGGRGLRCVPGALWVAAVQVRILHRCVQPLPSATKDALCTTAGGCASVRASR